MLVDDLADSHPDIDDLALQSLSHAHSAQRLGERQMVANHAEHELVRSQLVFKLGDEIILMLYWLSPRKDTHTISIQCLPFGVVLSFHLDLGIRRCRIMSTGIIFVITFPVENISSSPSK